MIANNKPQPSVVYKVHIYKKGIKELNMGYSKRTLRFSLNCKNIKKQMVFNV